MEDHRAAAYPSIVEADGCPAKNIELRIASPEERLTADFGTVRLVEPCFQRHGIGRLYREYLLETSTGKDNQPPRLPH